MVEVRSVRRDDMADIGVLIDRSHDAEWLWIELYEQAAWVRTIIRVDLDVLALVKITLNLLKCEPSVEQTLGCVLLPVDVPLCGCLSQGGNHRVFSHDSGTSRAPSARQAAPG